MQSSEFNLMHETADVLGKLVENIDGYTDFEDEVLHIFLGEFFFNRYLSFDVNDKHKLSRWTILHGVALKGSYRTFSTFIRVPGLKFNLTTQKDVELRCIEEYGIVLKLLRIPSGSTPLQMLCHVLDGFVQKLRFQEANLVLENAVQLCCKKIMALLKAGATVNVKDSTGWSSVHIMCHLFQWVSRQNLNVRVLRMIHQSLRWMLKSSDVDVNVVYMVGFNQQTLLSTAVNSVSESFPYYVRCLDTVYNLLVAGSDPNLGTVDLDFDTGPESPLVQLMLQLRRSRECLSPGVKIKRFASFYRVMVAMLMSAGADPYGEVMLDLWNNVFKPRKEDIDQDNPMSVAVELYSFRSRDVMLNMVLQGCRVAEDAFDDAILWIVGEDLNRRRRAALESSSLISLPTLKTPCYQPRSLTAVTSQLIRLSCKPNVWVSLPHLHLSVDMLELVSLGSFDRAKGCLREFGYYRRYVDGSFNRRFVPEKDKLKKKLMARYTRKDTLSHRYFKASAATVGGGDGNSAILC